MSLDDFVTFLNQHSMVALFAVIALGSLVGAVRITGISLGSTGVLLVGLLAGHLQVELPEAVSRVGVVLFAYAVGLHAGPRFLRTFRRTGWAFIAITLTVLVVAVLTCGTMAWAIGIPPSLASGVLSGALTSTPGLAASLEVLKDPRVAVGYGAAYPLGVMGVILFVHLVPRVLGMDLDAEAARADSVSKAPRVTHGWFKVTNPQIQDKTISDVATVLLTGTLISRVVKGEVTSPALNEVVLSCGDHVRAIGSESELKRLELLLGPRVADFEEAPSEVASTTLVVTESTIVGCTLAELRFRERYAVNVTRVWRDDFEIVPNAATTLEFGDTIRIVGHGSDCDRVVPVVGHQEERLQETDFTPLTLGLLIGVLLAFIALPLPGGLEVSLGLAGGPLLAGLIAGHFGRIGPLTFRVPLAAKYFIRELGLIFFLAGTGVVAGHQFWAVLQEQGFALIVGGLLTTLLPMVAAMVVARLILRWDAITSFGAICGAMTSTPGLGAVVKMSRSQASSLAYVAVYPTALIGITIFAPLLGMLLERLMSIVS